jgi:hypothetical protein
MIAPETMDWKNLEQQSKRWHDHEEELRELRRHLERSPNEVVRIFRMAEDRELGFKLYLQKEFGVNARTLEVQAGTPPLTETQPAKDLIMCGAIHTFWANVSCIKAETLETLKPELEKQQRVRRGPLGNKKRGTEERLLVRPEVYESAAQKVLYLYDELVTVFYEIGRSTRSFLQEGRLSPLQKRLCRELKYWADERLVSFMDTKLNVGINRRLHDALEELRRGTSLSSWQAKVIALREEVHVAFLLREEGMPIRPGSGATSVVSLVSHLIAEGELQGQRDVELDTLEDVGAEDREMFEYEEREYERQVLQTYLDDAGIVAEQERRIAEIMLEHEDRTGEQISVKETVARYKALTGETPAEGSVKSVRSRLRAKIGPVLGRT